MASIDPSLVSGLRDQKWVGQISEILYDQLTIDIRTTSVSIFQVPKTITTQKPEAYEPQQIGLGPYHHFRPQPYKKMEQKKLASVQRILQYHNIEKFDVLDEVKKHVPIVRACYDMFLEDDNESMAWVFAIDGLFLLFLLHTYDAGINVEEPRHNSHDSEIQQLLDSSGNSEFQDIDDSSHGIEITESDDASRDAEITEAHNSSPPNSGKHPKVDTTKRLLAKDIMMVENQIPFILLKKIDKAMHPKPGKYFLRDVFRSFCEIHSPLCLLSQAPTHVEHLLHYMYHSIVKPPSPEASSVHPFEASSGKPSLEYPVMKSSSMVDSIGHVSDFDKKDLQKQIVQLYKQALTTLQKFSTNKVSIPSASKLQGKARFNFHPLPENEDIYKIDFDAKNTFHLPVITLNSDSEVILRNLVAYEMLLPNSDQYPLTEYVGLMCGLVSNVRDVKLLKQKKIIKGDLDENEAVKLFVGMSRSIPRMKTKEISNLQKTIEKANKVYESSRMKASLCFQRLAETIALWLLGFLTVIGSFVGENWKIITLCISITFTGFTFIVKDYFHAFGCDKINAMPGYASG